MIDWNGIFCFLSLKPSRKYDVLERGFSKRLKTKATSFGLLGRKDRRTKIGNLCSCRCGCKLRESKTDKAFTQLNIINILCKQKLRAKAGGKIFSKGTWNSTRIRGTRDSTKISIGYQKMELIKNGHTLYRDNGPLSLQSRSQRPRAFWSAPRNGVVITNFQSPRL